MKKSKKLLSVLCAVCMVMAMAAPAFAADDNAIQPRIDQDPYDHATLTTADYDFDTSDDYPYFRLWIRNFDSKKVLGTITYEDGSTKQFSVPAANATLGYSDYTSAVINPGAGGHKVSLRADTGGSLNGELSLHVDATGHFRMGSPGYFSMAEDDGFEFISVQRIDQDPYDHAALTTAPYAFSTNDDYPYFRLWIRNTSSHAIYGTITYGSDSNSKSFTVPAADPDLGYSDYSSNIINPGAGDHNVTIRGESGYTMSGELSLHVDATGHFRAFLGWPEPTES